MDISYVAYGLQYDFDSSQRDSFIKLYLDKLEYEFQNGYIRDFESVNLDIRKEIIKGSGNKNSWLEFTYKLDTEESDDWSLTTSFKRNMMIFSLLYEEKNVEVFDIEDVERILGVGISFYFGDDL